MVRLTVKRPQGPAEKKSKKNPPQKPAKNPKRPLFSWLLKKKTAIKTRLRLHWLNKRFGKRLCWIMAKQHIKTKQNKEVKIFIGVINILLAPAGF
jgi:hypothetical protein